MKRYVLFVLNLEGTVSNTIDLYCADEKEAKERAEALVDGTPAELWDSRARRRIARLTPKR